jgi:hypothetical protein
MHMRRDGILAQPAARKLWLISLREFLILVGIRHALRADGQPVIRGPVGWMLNYLAGRLIGEIIDDGVG